MADSYTPNLNLRKPEVGAAKDNWGSVPGLNGDMDILDAIFTSDGSGTSVGLNVGTGKTADARGGTLLVTADRFFLQDGLDHSKTARIGVSFQATNTEQDFYMPPVSDQLVGLINPQTLLNKTLTAPAITDADIDGADMTGLITAPTPDIAVNDTTVATMAAVHAAIVAAIAGLPPGATQYWLPGMMAPYAGAVAPAGFLLADGSTKLVATYPDLSAVLGTTYGPNDGTNFTLPDLRGRAVFGADAMGGTAAGRLGGAPAGSGGMTVAAVRGAAAGTQVHTITPAQGPNMPVSVGSLVTTAGGSNVNSNFYDIGCIDGTNYGQATLTGGTTGGGTAHNNLPPALVTNYIIKT